MNILVLGAGLVGAPMAIDLAKDERFNVTVVDVNKEALQKMCEHPVKTVLMDLRFPEEVTRLVGNYDMVINAVPGFMGYQTLKAVIMAGGFFGSKVATQFVEVAGVADLGHVGNFGVSNFHVGLTPEYLTNYGLSGNVPM